MQRNAVLAFCLATTMATVPVSAADIAKLSTAYGARPSAWGVQLSPDGNKIVYFTPVGARGTAAVVADVATGETKVLVSNPDNKFEAQWCQWKSQQRIICNFYAIRMIEGIRNGFSRLLSLAADGSSTVELGGRIDPRAVEVATSSGRIIDWMPDDPKHVIMSVYVAEKETVGSLIGSTKGMSAKLVEVDTNRQSNIEMPNPANQSFGSDNHGNVRFKTVGSLDSDGYTRDSSTLLIRAKGSKEWKRLGASKFSGRRPLEFAGFDESGDNVFVLRDTDGRIALYKYATDGSDRTELTFAHPAVDVDGLLRIGKYSRPVGATYATDFDHVSFFDTVLDKRSRALSNALPGKPPVTITDESWDGVRNLIFAGGFNDPGSYYRFDTATKQLSALLALRPDLAEFKTAEQTDVTYPAADGTPIPAYLTMPAGGVSKNLPVIIMPHGGPSARDTHGFDWLSQYFAQLGYVVLQPNYRGSAGYGVEWYKKNGFVSWKTAIADINDGARWLVARGIADPKKVAIFGWSYGGYAALQANVLDPTLYKAAVAVAPVTDLRLLKDNAVNYTNYQLIVNEIGDGPHISEGSPARNAAKIMVPVLIFQGDQDLNVDPKQAKAMDSALNSAGKVHKLVMYPGLDHQLDDSIVRADMLRQSAEWLAAALAK